MKIGTIILAAGASTRMGGNPKQLIQYEGQSLIRRITEAAFSLDVGPVVVVLGANRNQLAGELTGLRVTLMDNPFWQTGMASSLKAGLAALYLTQKDIDAVLVLLTDQPHVNTGLLQQLIQTQQESGKGIVACRYANDVGVPVLFTRHYMEELLTLDGDRGAKSIVRKHADDCELITFDLGAVDLDTPNDVEQFRQSNTAN